jgi:hypothetical protein
MGRTWPSGQALPGQWRHPSSSWGGGGWGRATAAEAAVANDLALEGKGRLQECTNRAFLTRWRRLAGSKVALEERGRGPDLDGRGGGKGAAAGGAWAQRLSIRARRAMD